MVVNKNNTIRKIKLQLVSPTKYDWRNVALEIVKGFHTPYDKAKAIYDWLIDNISYDTTYTIFDADTAFQKRRGVCQAYCELFYRLGLSVGLDVRIISGMSKEVTGYISTKGHCWIAVNISNVIDKKFMYPENVTYFEHQSELAKFASTRGLQRNHVILIEPTWGAGNVDKGRFVHSGCGYWFDVKPEWMIFSHYPDNPQDQLLTMPISKKQFEALPFMCSEHENFGFSVIATLNTLLNDEELKLPEMSTKYSSYLTFEDIPLTSTLKRGAKYTLSFKKKRECEIVVFNGNAEHNSAINKSWSKTGNICTITLVTSDCDELSVGVNSDNSCCYNIFLTYKVT